jgi:hypothetical protein
MVAFNKFNLFTDDLVKGNHNFSTHTFKVMLTNVAPVATNHVTGDITDLPTANGYIAGGSQTIITLAPAAGVENVNGSNVVFTAGAGVIGPFRYAVLQNSTQSLLIGWWDYGSSIQLNPGETFTEAPTGGTLFTVT